MTTYVVSYNFPQSGRLFTFRCQAFNRMDAVHTCLAFHPGVFVIGAYTEEELQAPPGATNPERNQ